MSKQVFENLLEQYKRANQGAKQKLAEKNGFGTKEEYLKYLEIQVKGEVPKRKSKAFPKKLPIVYNVDILDASGSMSGGKYNNSCVGVKKGFVDLAENKEVKFNFTLVEFVERGRINEPFTAVEKVPEFKFAGSVGNNTPLYRTVFDTITRMRKLAKGEKVLVKVYTDGGNNTEYEYTAKCARLIKEVEKEGFTVTFVATEQDIVKITKDLSLDESNTLKVKNDARGFEMAFTSSLGSTQLYASKVSRGEDVSKGFYKKIGKL